MTAIMQPEFGIGGLSIVQWDSADIGQWPVPGAGVMIGQNRLAGEAIYNLTLTLTNVVSGSAWRVEETDGTLIDSGTASGTTATASVPYYGSTRDVVVKVRKGTASPFYQPYDTHVSIDGTASISQYVAQITDE